MCKCSEIHWDSGGMLGWADVSRRNRGEIRILLFHQVHTGPHCWSTLHWSTLLVHTGHWTTRNTKSSTVGKCKEMHKSKRLVSKSLQSQQTQLKSHRPLSKSLLNVQNPYDIKICQSLLQLCLVESGIVVLWASADPGHACRLRRER